MKHNDVLRMKLKDLLIIMGVTMLITSIITFLITVNIYGRICHRRVDEAFTEGYKFCRTACTMIALGITPRTPARLILPLSDVGQEHPSCIMLAAQILQSQQQKAEPHQQVQPTRCFFQNFVKTKDGAGFAPFVVSTTIKPHPIGRDSTLVWGKGEIIPLCELGLPDDWTCLLKVNGNNIAILRFTSVYFYVPFTPFAD